MKNLADYISENDDALIGSSTMKDNDTSKYEDVNEGQSTKCELEQYINEQKIKIFGTMTIKKQVIIIFAFKESCFFSFFIFSPSIFICIFETITNTIFYLI